MFKKIVSVALSAIFLISALASCSQSGTMEIPFVQESKGYSAEVEGVAMTIYVDSNVEASGDGSEAAPFKTVIEAQEKIRELKASETGLPAGGIRVLMAAGEYGCLSFTEEDSGTAESPITYVSAEKSGADIKSGTVLNASDFVSLVADEAARILNQNAVANIKKVDLKAYGLDADDWGELGIRTAWDTALANYGVTSAPEGELYINGDRSFLAMYPNNALNDTNKFLSFGLIVENVLSIDPNDLELRGSTFTVDDNTFEHVKEWQNPEEAWVLGYYRWEWADHAVPVGKVNADSKTVTLAYPCNEYLVENYKYIFYNVFEELDCAGEYYIDRENGFLYVYADESFEESTLVFANDTTPLLQATDISYITFKGLDIGYTRDYGVYIDTALHVTLDSCHVNAARVGGISVNVGNYVTISNCEVSNIGGQAITILNGGDAETLTHSENLIYNNVVRDFGQIKRTYAYGIWPGSIGTTVSHNEVYNSSHNALTTGSMLNVIEYNEIYNVCMETQDCAAIYTGYSFTGRGNVIRYNYIHDIGQPDTHTHGIYFDSSYSGQTVYGNIFENTGYTGLKAGSGRDNVIVNNIFIDCGSAAMDYAAIEIGHWNRDMWLDGSTIEALVLQDFMGQIGVGNREGYWNYIYYNDVWQEAFPEIYTTRFDFDPAVDSYDDPAFFPNPTGHLVENNVVIMNYGTGNIRKNQVYMFDSDIKKFSTIGENILLQFDMSSFVDPDNKDFTMKENSIIKTLLPEFENIPFYEIGLVEE